MRWDWSFIIYPIAGVIRYPNWPYFEDVKIERLHYMAKSGVLTQRFTTTMHSSTHIDAPAHVVQGTPFIDEVPLPHFFGSILSCLCRRRNGSRLPAMILKKPAGAPSGRTMS